MGIIIGFLIIINIFLIGIIISIKTDIDFYKNKCESYIREIVQLNASIRAYQSRNTYQDKSKNIYNNDIKEAVKYAMKKSHPDNGGSSDEFNKFRNLYERIK